MTLHLRPWQRHSLVLAVAGLVYVGIGIAYLATPTNPTRQASLRWVLTVAPLPAWSTAFIVVGLLALVSTRWPPASKTWGYAALSGLACLWGAGFLVSVLFLDSPSSGLTGALIWGLVGFLWWAIAGLVNPDDFPPTSRQDTDDPHAER